MADVFICSAAENEFSEALGWYARRNAQAALGFDLEVDQAIQRIGETPDRYPRFDDRHHFYLMHRFPYMVVYRATSERVVIVAFAHTSRSPDYWTMR